MKEENSSRPRVEIRRGVRHIAAQPLLHLPRFYLSRIVLSQPYTTRKKRSIIEYRERYIQAPS